MQVSKNYQKKPHRRPYTELTSSIVKKCVTVDFLHVNCLVLFACQDRCHVRRKALRMACGVHPDCEEICACGLSRGRKTLGVKESRRLILYVKPHLEQGRMPCFLLLLLKQLHRVLCSPALRPVLLLLLLLPRHPLSGIFFVSAHKRAASRRGRAGGAQ